MRKPENLQITSSPHFYNRKTTAKIMWSVVICLLPAAAWGVYNFGLRGLLVLLVSIGAAMGTEFIITIIQKKKSTLFDGSAFLTGLLVGFNMSPAVPGFIPILASVFAIAVVKHSFGGLGRNWMNPALAGRVFAMFCWTGEMTTWTAPLSAPDVMTGASPLAVDAYTSATPLAVGADKFLETGSYLDLFLGRIPGCIGEVSALLLLLGTVYLFIKKIITWEIPVSYIGTFTILTFIFGGIPSGGGLLSGDILFHLLSGGLILGAFYMATDMVTSPLTWKGQLIFGAGCGFFTFLIRIFGGFPEGVSLAIILMNIFVPLINRFTKPIKFGFVKEKKQ